MKKIAVTLFVIFSMMMSQMALAQSRWDHHKHRQSNDGNLGKIILGVAAVGALATIVNQNRVYQYEQPTFVMPPPPPPTVYYQPPPPVYVQPAPIIVQRQEPIYLERISNLRYDRLITVDGVTYFERNGIFYQRDQYGYYEVPRPF